jgi:indole-3-glycerol phosphate synthase
MWDKETEVDRLRERVPLSNLVSQCKLFEMDPSKPNPSDWIGAFKRAADEKGFVVIPELKRIEPKSGSLRKRYDVSKLTKQMVAAESPMISVNCDAVLFGGNMEDVTTVREKISTSILESADAEEGVVPIPILASDLVLYPYQLYKLRLAGTDAVNIVVGALSSKDLLYLTKIAATLKLQIIASVTSETQIRSLTKLSGGIHALVMSNRNLETFGFDDSGDQALSLLKSEAAQEFKDKFGEDVPILVEGRVGVIQINDEDGNPSSKAYVKALRDAGAMGAIVGSGLVTDSKEGVVDVMKSLQNI